MSQSLRQLLKWIRGTVLRRMPLMITCRQFEEFILAYLEGELSDRQQFVFELHIKVCRECRNYLAAYKRTIDISRRAFDEPDQSVPDDVPEDLIKAILSARDA